MLLFHFLRWLLFRSRTLLGFDVDTECLLELCRFGLDELVNGDLALWLRMLEADGLMLFFI
jgi:hypothetical protein